jgi:DNA-binding FadR family transcriptional regulator
LGADRLCPLRIADATNNAALVHVVKSLWEERGSLLFSTLQYHFGTPRSWASANRERAAVLEAIRADDPERARAAMYHHMEQAARRSSRSRDGG